MHRVSTLAPWWMIAFSAVTMTGSGFCQMLRPNTTPLPPASMEPCTTSSAARAVSIFVPPAIITGTGQFSTTRRKLSALPV